MPELPATSITLRRLSTHRGLRVLAWDRAILYVSRGYELLRLKPTPASNSKTAWERVAIYSPVWWRNLTSRNNLTHRLVRDGFHALAVLADQTMIAAVPGAIAKCEPNSNEFRPTHKIQRGTRPLHITAVPNGNIYWGEYFDNRDRAEVHIYSSTDQGQTWQVAHTFPAKAVRHVHNIVYDRHADCLWILTGDDGHECKILRADRNLRNIEVVGIPTKDALYVATDTPFEQNHVLRLDRAGKVETRGDLASSSIFGCQTANALFFSTMVEPSPANLTREVHLAGSTDGANWRTVARWRKDALSMHYFQYGNAILPDGENTTNYLTATTVAVKQDDQVTTLWEVSPNSESRAPKAESPKS
jgi:hypothetical protein